MNNTLDKCPHCGSEKDAFICTHLADQHHYECKTWKTTTLTHRTNLCIVREARQKAEAELEKVTDQKRKITDILEDAIADLSILGFPYNAGRYQSSLRALEGK